MNTLGRRPCFTGSLTTGADAFVGGASADVFNALTVKADGADATTLSPFDSIDGGAGKDTLNIYSNGVQNAGLNGATVKNVETININNSDSATAHAGFGAVDASKFVGATAINQVNVANTVNNLAAGTVAGFQNIAAPQAFTVNVNVNVTDSAATAAVALSNVTEGSSVVVNAGAAGVLNSVTVSGVQADSNNNGTVANNTVVVAVGKDVETLTLNTASGTTLTVNEQAVVAKHVTTVDASASTGDVSYNGLVGAAKTVSTIKTGVGKDTVTLQTALTATAKAASVSTGEGDDTLNILATAAAASAATVAVDAGAGNDTINLTINSDITYNVAGGAGDDTVVITGPVKTTDKIDGGAGTDTVSLATAGTLVADDYIVFNKVLTNFETLKLTSAVTNLDAGQLAANYTTLDLATGSAVDNVAAQTLVANGALNAEAAGYLSAAESLAAGGASAIVYAGTLNITDKLLGTVQAHADTVNLTVKGGSANGVVANNATLTGEAKSATVTLSAATNTKGTVATADDVLVASKVTITQGTAVEGLKDLASLTLSGNGTAVVNVGALVAAESKLVNVDASGLNSVDIAGKAAIGLQYTSFNSAAETIKLGAGIDTVTLNASTYGKVDIVSGLNLVASAADAKAIDVLKSDVLKITGVKFTVGDGFKGFTTTQTDLQLALKDAAAYSAANSHIDLAFQQGGNTYVFHDAKGAGASVGLIDAADTVVQITGQVNLDLLASSLAHVA